MVRIHALILASALVAPALVSALVPSFLQLRGSNYQGGVEEGNEGSETCTDLLNKGAYFAVNVGIGTPVGETKPQSFELVADTGSDSVIVTSCVCVQQGFCGKDDPCFMGTNRSSSFIVKELPVNKSTNKTSPLGVAMSFGSGTVMSIIATDVVNVANQHATMKDGVLLMVDRRMLAVQGEFQGILGLGPPDLSDGKKDDLVSDHSEGEHDTDHDSEAGKEEDHDTDDTDKDSDEKDDNSSAPVGAIRPVKGKDSKYSPKVFLQRAGVDRYSLCFNEAGNPGAMRVNVPAFKRPLPTIGSFHWGLGLHGISSGSADADHFACNSGDKTVGKHTPCGAIPDSGTTLLMGPPDQVQAMFESLCDDWDRCKEAQDDKEYKDDKGKKMPKHHVFQKLLYKCDDWKTDEHGIDEVPSVFFTVGEPGNQQKLELTPWSFIVETQEEQYKHHTRYLFGLIPVDVPKPTGKMKSVCVPSFGVQQYNTKDNGPVWIMGHPLFYQFNVGYSLGKESGVKGATGKMAMSFTKEKCTSCSEPKASLLASGDDLSSSPRRARKMRFSNYPPMVPERDLSLPL